MWLCLTDATVVNKSLYVYLQKLVSSLLLSLYTHMCVCALDTHISKQPHNANVD